MTEYRYFDGEATFAQAYLAEPVLGLLRASIPAGGRVLELGCGNGSFCGALLAQGYAAWGVDTSTSGIEIAKRGHPTATLRAGSVYEPIQELFPGSEPFHAVVALEVVEHLYSPAAFVERAYEALLHGGLLVLSTPYHGYLKNLALALTGRLDGHFTALWEGGHIKFWSRATLTALVERGGFAVEGFAGAGRAPYLWKSMILTARRP